MTGSAGTDTAANARPGSTPGPRLKAAREAAGLSVDAVARQLKLAPRQVKALEEDDWSRLPGRTFIRGFARNYARFVRIDPDALVALMPAADTVPALERPTLAGSGRPMGEIPIERVGKPSAARWLIPLLLVGVVAAIAYFGVPRPPFRLGGLASSIISGKHIASPAPAPLPTPPAATTVPGTATSTLPNPVATSVAPATPATNAVAAPPVNADAASKAPAANADTEPKAPAGNAATPPDEARLVLVFKGTSWAEVKDAKGRVVLQMTGGPGMTQTVAGTPPLEVALGNAPAVGVTYRGQPVDLAPYTRGGVARVSLK